MGRNIILLADDDIDDREMFCEGLSAVDKELQCDSAINGLEAIEKLSKLDKLPKLIFLDLNMPVMDGWQCISVLKEDDRYKEIPVLMISTSSHKRDIKMALEKGAAGYLVKPSNFNTLNRILKAIVTNIESDIKSCISSLQAAEPGVIFSSIV